MTIHPNSCGYSNHKCQSQSITIFILHLSKNKNPAILTVSCIIFVSWKIRKNVALDAVHNGQIVFLSPIERSDKGTLHLTVLGF